jgi:hypothetical protein
MREGREGRVGKEEGNGNGRTWVLVLLGQRALTRHVMFHVWTYLSQCNAGRDVGLLLEMNKELGKARLYHSLPVSDELQLF